MPHSVSNNFNLITDLDAVVGSVGDKDEPVPRAGHAPRPAQLAVVGALAPELEELLANSSEMA